MPRSGTGVYTLPAGNPVVTLTTIASSWANNTMSDIATALTQSLATNGVSSMTGPLLAADGSVGAPGLSWASEGTSGWYRLGVNQFGFSVGANLSLSVNANRDWIISAPASGTALTINGSGGAVSSNVPTLNASQNSTNLWMLPSNTAGGFNGIVAGGDSAIVAGGTSVVGTGVLTLTAWSNTNVGIRISSVTNTVAISGNVTMAAPASGQTLAVTAGTDLTGILINGAQNNVSLTINNTQAGASANWRFSSSATGSGFGAGNLVIGIGSSNFINVAGTGNVTIASPSTGIALGVNGFSGSPAILANSIGATGTAFWASGPAATKTQFFVMQQAGQGQWTYYAQASSNDLHLFNSTQATDTLLITGAGNWTINPPNSGNTLTINALSGANALAVNGAAIADIVVSIGNVAGGQVAIAYAINSVVQGYTGFAGAAGQLVADSAAGDYVARTASKAFRVSINNGTNTSLLVDSTGLTNVSNGTGISPVYAGIPQNSQSASYTLVLADANKHIRATGLTAGQTMTIPSNASVAYPIGTAITFANRASAVWTISINSDTLQWSTNNTSGTRTLAINGTATALKTDSNVWLISGAGLS